MKKSRLKNLALNIKTARIRKELTQQDLAFEINVSQHSISQIEQYRQTPSALMIYDIANALEISLDELFKGVPKRTDGE
ncbi:hypothetical protein DBY21_01405 [Candidatus Gastranaerophilales bacterium]|nr:MAG: hypothetical protein DBY21_01405 [Candidatus Gastranaerophilales bacterium]